MWEPLNVLDMKLQLKSQAPQVCYKGDLEVVNLASLAAAAET